MKKQEYAIVDIETTGGNATHSRITEIAIIIHDGEKVIDRWETLVNPQKHIPDAIFALTGITNEMVREAPIFDLISDQVFELLKDRVFVAHNVNFDYSFVRHELERAGLKWTAKKLCTVRAARKIKPGLPSYSLGRLCSSLDIDLENRHRAGGDADATAILLSRLLEWDHEKVMDVMIKKTSQEQQLPPNLPKEDFDQLPDKPGVYYFYDEHKKVVYIGKAVNLKKRVSSHFGGHKITPQRQHFLRDIYAITYEVCGTELMALLLECSEIKQLWPIHNKALKRFEPKFGLFEYEARNGYRYLAIGKLAKNQNCLETFDSIYRGINLLQELAKQFEIDQRFCKYGSMSDGVFTTHNDTAALPEIEVHNDTIQVAIDFYLNSRPSFAIIDKGRTTDERSCIWVENGHFFGMGYLDSDLVITDPSQVKEYVTPCKSNQYIMQLIFSHAQKYPRTVHIQKRDDNFVAFE
ncbi:exonuclease domain-containing protein [Flavobacterium sandaracinum]|uniref:DNA polymerase III subunit epsilon n=1 Tax=Flavobacterium sandaracinum TaxID=2541733 RepID=A0A4V2Z1P3_9FLAO|nr:exonuclease domain-containing protein [Flavobacterium sandaracinum]TDE05688.1 DNA polymerase III subunit epsilon [Flavobacterium sandaracinum]